jgi:hypothetical protein
MPQIIPAGYAAVSMRFLLENDAEPMFMTFGVDIETASLDDVAEGVFQAWVDQLSQEFASVYTLTGVECYTADQGGNSTSVNAVGTGTFNSTPQNVAILIRKTNPLRGRAHQGRMFQPSADRLAITDTGALTFSYHGQLQTAYNLFYVDIRAITGVAEIVILHSAGAIAPTPVSAFSVDQRVATQRRRLR